MHWKKDSVILPGESYVKNGEYDKAEKCYIEALKSKPDHIPAHLTMAKLFQKKVTLVARWNDVIEDWEMSILSVPERICLEDILNI